MTSLLFGRRVLQIMFFAKHSMLPVDLYRTYLHMLQVSKKALLDLRSKILLFDLS